MADWIQGLSPVMHKMLHNCDSSVANKAYQMDLYGTFQDEMISIFDCYANMCISSWIRN